MSIHVLLALGVLFGAAQAQDFNYNQNGADWEGLCATGRSQSPIVIYRFTTVSTPYQPLVLGSANSVEYSVSEEIETYRLTALQPASTLTAVPTGGSMVTNFVLDNINFHSPSEHRIGTRVLDLEMQLVHYNSRRMGAVLSVFYYVSSSRSPLLDSIMQGEPLNLVAELGYPIRNFYFYVGSLTTPPCTEQVNWFLPIYGRETGLPATQDQIDWITGQWGNTSNNRQTRPQNARTVYLFVTTSSTSFLNTS